jgi:hypothetical protein
MESYSIAQLTSLPAVVAAAVFLTYLAKRLLGSVPVAAKVPTWVYTATIAGALAFVANRIVGSLPGQTGMVVIDAIIYGALASGVRTWVQSFNAPIEDSGTARKAAIDARFNSWLLPLLLTGSVLASSCAGFMPGPSVSGPTPPAATLNADQVNQKAVEFAAVGTAVLGLAQQALEFSHIVIPPSPLRLEINDAASALGRTLKDIATRAKSIVDEPTLRTVYREILNAADSFLGALGKSTHTQLAEYSTAIQNKLQVVRAFLTGGAR